MTRPSASCPCASSRSSTCCVVLLGPVSIIFWRTSRRRRRQVWTRPQRRRDTSTRSSSRSGHGDRGAAQHGLRHRLALALVRRRFPGGARRRPPRPAARISPVVVGLALFLLYGRDGWFGPGSAPRHPGDLRPPRHGPGDGVRLAAARRARGHAGAARDRRRPGAGRAHARRRAAGRRSGASRCPRSAGRSPTASCSPPPAASASTARSRSCRAASRARPRPRPSCVQSEYQNFDLAGAYAHLARAALAIAIAACSSMMTPSLRPKESSLMSIARPARHKRFGDFVALDDVNARGRRRLADRAARPERRRQVDAAARSSPGSRRPTPARR